MIRKIKFSVLLLIIASVIIYLDYKISTYDMRFYYGKDDGIFVRLESICELSTLFFLVMSKHNRVLNIIIGFFAGLFSSIFTYLVVLGCFHKYLNNNDLVFHIISCLVFIKLFFVIEKILPNRSLINLKK